MQINPKVAVFDFDGVITQKGEQAKIDAWAKLALKIAYDLGEPYENTQRVVEEKRVDHLEGRIKGSRFEILGHIFLSLGYGYKEIPELIETYSSRYQELSLQEIVRGGLAEGVVETLQALQGLGMPMYLNSATPHSAIALNAKEIGVAHFFKAIFGEKDSVGGNTKVENLKEVALRERISDRHEILFVGDGKGDAKAGEAFGCQFVGIPNEFNGWGNSGSKTSFRLVKCLPDILPLFGLSIKS